MRAQAQEPVPEKRRSRRFLAGVVCAAVCAFSVFFAVPADAKIDVAAFSVATEETAAWNATLDDYFAGTLNARVPQTVLSRTPKVLARLLADDGVPAEEMRLVVNKSILDKTLGKTASKFTGEFHHVGETNLRALPAELADPVAVFDSAHGNGDKVVLTTLKDTESGESVIVAVAVATTRGHETVNAVSSMHGRQVGSFRKWMKDGLLRYFHTKKFPQWLDSVGVQNPRAAIPCGNGVLNEKDFADSARDGAKRKNKSPNDGKELRK